MFSQYIPSFLLLFGIVIDFGLGSLTFGTYFLRVWQADHIEAKRQRELSRKSGVYCITNTAIGACYIGSTTRSFAARWGQHIGELEAGTHTNAGLLRDWNLYGPDAFTFTPIEFSANEAHMRAREIEWIDAARLGLSAWLVYNREGFNRGKRAMPSQDMIAALHDHVTVHTREAAAYRQAHPIAGVR